MLREPTIAPVGESTVVGGPTRVEPVEVDPDVRSGLVDERDVVPEVPALGPGAPLPQPPAPPRLRLGPPPATDRLRGWIVTLTLTLIAGVVRFVGLDRPTDGGTPVFDEKHYVPQAWQMLRNGGVEDNPGYELVVHPPLGKQLIAIGEWLLGYNGWGWRAAAALAGTITVLLVIRVARRLTRSTLLGAAAGVLLICDGLSHVQSRMGMLDAFAAMFVLAAFATLLCDRDDVRARMAVVLAEGRIDDSPYGPRLGVRWWRFATGRAARARLCGEVVGRVLARRVRGAHPGLRPDGTASRRRAAALGRDDRPRPRARRVGAGPAPGAGLPRGRGGRGSAARRASTATSSAWTAARTASARTVRGRSSPTRCGRCGSSAGTSSTSTPGSRRSPAASTRGSPSRGRGRWACGRCSITTRPATRSRAAAPATASAPSC